MNYREVVKLSEAAVEQGETEALCRALALCRFSTRYTVVVPPSLLKDTSGNSYAGSGSGAEGKWSFSTESAAEAKADGDVSESTAEPSGNAGVAVGMGVMVSMGALLGGGMYAKKKKLRLLGVDFGALGEPSGGRGGHYAKSGLDSSLAGYEMQGDGPVASPFHDLEGPDSGYVAPAGGGGGGGGSLDLGGAADLATPLSLGVEDEDL